MDTNPEQKGRRSQPWGRTKTRISLSTLGLDLDGRNYLFPSLPQSLPTFPPCQRDRICLHFDIFLGSCSFEPNARMFCCHRGQAQRKRKACYVSYRIASYLIRFPNPTMELGTDVPDTFPKIGKLVSWDQTTQINKSQCNDTKKKTHLTSLHLICKQTTQTDHQVITMIDIISPDFT